MDFAIEAKGLFDAINQSIGLLSLKDACGEVEMAYDLTELKNLYQGGSILEFKVCIVEKIQKIFSNPSKHK